MKVSVVIPNYNGEKSLLRTLEALKNQTFQDFELVVVDDCSTDGSLAVARKYAGKVLSTLKNSGPATARNMGIKNSQGELILLTDADCVPSLDWVEKMTAQFKNNGMQVVMGKVEIERSNFIGDSISALGYPAGGSIGFENIWKVSPEGYTSTFSSCNCGFRRKVFDEFGFFDEDFPCAGGEDTLLARKISNGGGKIKYCPEAVVTHEARAGLRAFMRWQAKRGECIYLFRKKVGSIKGDIKNRLWSISNTIKMHLRDPKIFMIIPLLALSMASQQYGYLKARFNDRAK